MSAYAYQDVVLSVPTLMEAVALGWDALQQPLALDFRQHGAPLPALSVHIPLPAGLGYFEAVADKDAERMVAIPIGE